MSRSLFDISADMTALEALLDETENFDDPKVQALLCEWAEENQTAFETKVDNYCAFIQTLLARSEARETESKRLASLAKSDSNNAIRLRERLKLIFEQRKIAKLKTSRFNVGIQGNGGVLPLEITVRPEDLPEQYRTTTVAANNDAIRQALEAGHGIEGCAFGKRGTSLRIR